MKEIAYQTANELASMFNVPPPLIVFEELPPGVLGLTSEDGSVIRISPRIKNEKQLRETVAHEFWHYLLIKKGIAASRKEHEISAGIFEQLWSKLKEGYYAKFYTCPKCEFFSPMEKCISCGYEEPYETNVLICQNCGSLIKGYGDTVYCKNCGYGYTLCSGWGSFFAGFLVGAFVTVLVTTAIGRRITIAGARIAERKVRGIGERIAEKLEARTR
jgi:hypothetical protein